jgi:ribonuclease D
VWEQRPLSEELLRYAATDVRYLHVLEEALNMRLPQLIVEKVREE